MPIRFENDAAAVVPPSNNTTRKYGQSLVLQQQQQKYAAQQAGYDRMFQLARDHQQNMAQATREGLQNADRAIRDAQQNAFIDGRDQQRQQMQEAAMQNAVAKDARKQKNGIIMSGIKNGEYDPVTSRRLQDNLIAESEVLGNPKYDAAQREEALQKIYAERELLSDNRIPKPTRDEQLQTFLGESYATHGHLPWIPDGKGGFTVSKEALAAQQEEQKRTEQMRPQSAEEYYNHPDNKGQFQKDLDATMKSMEKNTDALGNLKEEVTPEAAWEKMKKAHEFRQKALGKPQLGEPTPAPAILPDAITLPGTMGSIIEPTQDAVAATQQPQPGMGEIGAMQNYVPGSSQPEQMPNYVPGTSQPEQIPNYVGPNSGTPAAPDVLAAPSLPPVQQQQVKVGGKPLAVTPGALTPQETKARTEFMQLPREQRIAALMPYEPELNGKTLEQFLDSPETKAQYDELTKQKLTTGNYREDMLTHLDEMLQHNVLNAAGSAPRSAYVGMRADDITDPKAKAEIAKLPRPKNKKDHAVIRSGQSYVDPEGVIRIRS